MQERQKKFQTPFMHDKTASKIAYKKGVFKKVFFQICFIKHPKNNRINWFEEQTVERPTYPKLLQIDTSTCGVALKLS